MDIKTVFIIFLIVPISLCFFPNRFYSGLTITSTSHTGIIRNAFERIFKDVAGQQAMSDNVKNARDEISDANEEVDSKESELTASHFDAENFIGAQGRLKRIFSLIITSINDGNYSPARTYAGQYIHTMQDFYSHSTWIENGNTSPNYNLGTDVSIDPPSPDTRTYDKGTRREVSGILTSGYYGGQDRTLPSTKKCIHGGPFDSYSKCGTVEDNDDIWCTFSIDPDTGSITYINTRTNEKSNVVLVKSYVGINKDSTSGIFSPHDDLHNIAVKVAEEATYDLFNRIKERVTKDKFSAFLGIKRGIAFAIDTTGSMSDEIATVKAFISATIKDSSGENYTYIIAPFNDPSVGPVKVFTDPSQALSMVSSLVASGGGDCPELSISGTIQAIDSSPAGTVLYRFTDADAKDSYLAPEAKVKAYFKDIKIIDYITGSCSRKKRLDSTYTSLTTSTGGILFEISKGLDSLSATIPITKIISYTDLQSLLFSPTGNLNKYIVNVDSSAISLIIFCASCQNITMIFNGINIVPTNKYVAGNNIVIEHISPPSGSWEINVKAIGNFSIQVLERSNIGVSSSFRYMPTSGSHPGYIKYDGNPPGGTIITNFLELGFNATSSILDILNTDNSIYSTNTMTSFGSNDVWFSNVTLPRSFIMRFTITNTLGDKLVRYISSVLTSTSIIVSSNTPYITLAPGETKSISVTISSNSVSSTNIDITPRFSLGNITINSTKILVPGNGNTIILINITASKNITKTSSTSLSIIATDSKLSDNTNYLLTNVAVVVDDTIAPSCSSIGSCICKTGSTSCNVLISATDDKLLSTYALGSTSSQIVSSNRVSDTVVSLEASVSCSLSQETLKLYDGVGNTGTCIINVSNRKPDLKLQYNVASKQYTVLDINFMNSF